MSRYNEAEVSLEEMESGSSAYMKEDLLKRKFTATWQELCGIVGISSEIEITSDEVASGYTKTPYPEINRRVTRLLRRNEFPDHYDIVELIERCNTKYELGISAEEKTQLSREVFKDVGRILKTQRAKDFKAHFGCHLTDDALKNNEDPATSDSALLEMLRKSLREGQEKLEVLCEGFVVKQERECEQDKSTEGDPCESDEDGGEEEEEEGEREGEDVVGMAEDDDCVDKDRVINNEEVEEDSDNDEEDIIDDNEEVQRSSRSSSEADEATLAPIPTKNSSPSTTADKGNTSTDNISTKPTKRLLSDDSEDNSTQPKIMKMSRAESDSSIDDDEGDEASTSAGTDRDKGKATTTTALSRSAPATTPPADTVISLLDDDDDDSDSDVIVLSD